MSENSTTSPSTLPSGTPSTAPFRSAVQPPRASTPAPVAKDDGTDHGDERTIGTSPATTNPTLDEYRLAQEKPFSHEYLGLGTPFGFLPGAEQKQLETIDRLVEMELSNRHEAMTIRNASNMLTHLKDELGIGDLSLPEQMERLSGFARNIVKLYEIDEIKGDLRNRLRRMGRSRDMDEAVLKVIGKKIL